MIPFFCGGFPWRERQAHRRLGGTLPTDRRQHPAHRRVARLHAVLTFEGGVNRNASHALRRVALDAFAVRLQARNRRACAFELAQRLGDRRVLWQRTLSV